MPEELVLQVRWPIADLEAQARAKYGLKEKLADFKVEGDVLVLIFARGSTPPAMISTTVPMRASKKGAGSGPAPPVPVQRRRKKGKRNRMRTRGWAVEAKVSTSRGHTATIYKPFVDALKDANLSPAEQRAIVARILRSNGNQPQEGSIEYFLSNTLEYLSGKAKRLA